MELQVRPADLVNRLLAVSQGDVIPGGGNHILIACMPKSASTFLTTAISKVPGMNLASLTFGHHRREQELCPLQCALVHSVSYVAQHHVRYSDSTQRILTCFGLFPVILTRNIFDCVVSTRDHIQNGKIETAMAYLPAHFRELSKEKQYDLIIDMMVPWYANFFCCWADYKGPCLRIMYRHMIEDFRGTILRILRQVNFAVTPAAVDEAMDMARQEDVRFNVGKVGRGPEELSRKQIARIQELFSNYSYVEGVQEILYMQKAG